MFHFFLTEWFKNTTILKSCLTKKTPIGNSVQFASISPPVSPVPSATTHSPVAASQGWVPGPWRWSHRCPVPQRHRSWASRPERTAEDFSSGPLAPTQTTQTTQTTQILKFQIPKNWSLVKFQDDIDVLFVWVSRKFIQATVRGPSFRGTSRPVSFMACSKKNCKVTTRLCTGLWIRDDVKLGLKFKKWFTVIYMISICT